jgi:preprotein translocase subunit SecD
MPARSKTEHSFLTKSLSEFRGGGCLIDEAIAMTTLQKTLITATLAVVTGAGIYQAHRASGLRDAVQALEQQQAALTEQVAQFKSDNESLSNQLDRANGSPSVSSERLRELLKLRGEVGVLRRRQRELEQTLAADRSDASRSAGQASTAVAAQPKAPAPFQVQLVADEPGENTEPLTNNAGGADAETLHVQKTPLLDHTAIHAVTVNKNAVSGEPEIDVEFSDVGKELFAAVTKENLNKRLAIVLNGQVYSAPVIRSEITEGKAQITGHFTEEEARELAARINEAIRSQ